MTVEAVTFWEAPAGSCWCCFLRVDTDGLQQIWGGRRYNLHVYHHLILFLYNSISHVIDVTYTCTIWSPWMIETYCDSWVSEKPTTWPRYFVLNCLCLQRWSTKQNGTSKQTLYIYIYRSNGKATFWNMHFQFATWVFFHMPWLVSLPKTRTGPGPWAARTTRGEKTAGPCHVEDLDYCRKLMMAGIQRSPVEVGSLSSGFSTIKKLVVWDFLNH